MPDSTATLARLHALLAAIQGAVRSAHRQTTNHAVAHVAAADTIYAIDAEVDPILIEHCEQWGREQPLVLIAEGVRDERGVEGPRVFPAGTPMERAEIRLVVDPIDGTRHIMYDKRSAWCLAGVAPNRGAATRLSDIEVAMMIELPTSKAGAADVLWAVRGRGARGERVDLRDGSRAELTIKPSAATTLEHGYASVANYFPGVKVPAAQLIEFMADRLIGAADFQRASLFDDQYISSGGQLYELMTGHDRFVGDLRTHFYSMLGGVEGLCAHPYDLCTMLIAQEAGVVLTDGLGGPLDGPLDCTTGLSWAGFANAGLRDAIQPLIVEWFARQNRTAGSDS